MKWRGERVEGQTNDPHGLENAETMKRSHMTATGIAALGLLVILALAVGCTRETSGTSTQSTAARLPDANDATAQAEATLREFFQAWTAKDVAAWKALLSDSRQKEMNLGDWTFADLDHIEFGTVVAVPEAIDSYVTYGSGSRQGLDRDDVRCFRAPLTFYLKPGIVGTNDSGEELPWLWWLVQGADGKWRVDDWGA